MKTWCGVACLLLIASCDGEAENNGNGADEQVTLAGLPDAARAAFAAWQTQVVKDCAWQQAFPSLDTDPAYAPSARVDLAQLLAAGGGTHLIAGPAGQLALLGDAPASATVARNERDAVVAVNGVARALHVRASRDGNTCTIELGGQRVFRAELPDRVPVIASYDPAAPVTGQADLPALVDGRAGATEVAALDPTALLASATSALRPDPRVHGWLAARLATDAELARAVFPLGEARAPAVVRLPALDGATPFSPSATLFGPRAQLATLYAGGPATLELLFDRLDDELVALRVELAIGAGGTAVTAHAIAAAPHVAHDDDAMTACFLARGVASRFEPEAPHSPAFDVQLAGCHPLARNPFVALGANPATRQVIATHALGGGVVPGGYRGWDTAELAMAQHLVVQDQPLAALDPSGALTALGPIVDRYAALRAAIDDPQIQRARAPDLVALSFQWFFRALAPAPALLDDLGRALHNTTSYSTSALTMLTDLGASVSPLSAGARAAACGAALTGSRRAQVDHAIAAVAAVPHGAPFTRKLVDTVLQRCPDPAALAALETSAAATSAFITADAARAGSSVGFGSAADDVVSHALDERWTAATFAALADVLDFALVSDALFCATRTARAEQATCVDVGLQLLSAAGRGILAPDVAARYAAMARELTARWPALDDAHFLSSKLDVTLAWTNGLWRACTNDDFARAKAQLYALFDRLAVAGSGDRLELVNQISALLRTCR